MFLSGLRSTVNRELTFYNCAILLILNVFSVTYLINMLTSDDNSNFCTARRQRMDCEKDKAIKVGAIDPAALGPFKK